LALDQSEENGPGITYEFSGVRGSRVIVRRNLGRPQPLAFDAAGHLPPAGEGDRLLIRDVDMRFGPGSIISDIVQGLGIAIHGLLAPAHSVSK
jgi:hypothetical protein